MKKTAEMAYAKINLSLDVTGRRENGYHEVDGVMQCISLFDEVTVQLEEAEALSVVLNAEGNPDLPTDDRNLAVRAARMFFERIERCCTVEIGLVKRIPMAGGLAGGSTDAAAVLRACNRLMGDPLTVEELCTLGARLGADVPFCIVGGAMRTQGIGEVLSSVPSMPMCHIVIAKRGEGISTPWAYGRLDALYSSFAEGTERPCSCLHELLAALEQGDLSGVCAHIYNIFEPVAEECRPDVSLIRRIMVEQGAAVSRMSGSGPSVFGVFLQERDAQNACSVLREMGAEAHICHPVAEEFFCR